MWLEKATSNKNRPHSLEYEILVDICFSGCKGVRISFYTAVQGSVTVKIDHRMNAIFWMSANPQGLRITNMKNQLHPIIQTPYLNGLHLHMFVMAEIKINPFQIWNHFG